MKVTYTEKELENTISSIIGKKSFSALSNNHGGYLNHGLRFAIEQCFVYGDGTPQEQQILRSAAKDLYEKGHFIFPEKQQAS